METHEVRPVNHTFSVILITFFFSDMHAVSEHLLFSGTRRSNFAQEKTPTVAMIKPVWMVNGISETLTMKQRK